MNERTKQVLIYNSTFRDVITKVSRIPCVIASEMKLLPQQLLIVLQMMRQRSIIVVHSTGSGKTLTAVTVAECLLRNDMIDRIVVVSPKTLVQNFKNTLEYKYGAVNFKAYEFYSYETFAKKCSNGEIGDLSETLLVFDEAHMLKTEIGPAKLPPRSYKFYGMKLPKRKKFIGKVVPTIIEHAKESKKLLLLTATPTMNGPHDIAEIY